ncbi:MAG: AI-2E family transporter, partial [Clostridia bacterium]|nr:AI-2E family transporter [Clostridia bacterium]
LYFAIILGIAVFLCRCALGPLTSFIIALLVSLLLKPLIRFLREKCHIHKTVAGIVVVILFYALIAFLLTVLGIKLFSWLKNLMIALPEYYASRIEPFIMNVFASLERFTERLDPSAAAAYDVIAANLTQSLEEGIVSLSRQVVGMITNAAVGTPGFLLDMLIMIIATVFIAVDWTTIKEFILRQFSDDKRRLLHDIRRHLGLTLMRYIKSYALIMGITFAEICIGLLIVGVKNAVLIALLIAVFDILPVVGSGMVLLPWTIITALQGDYLWALGL